MSLVKVVPKQPSIHAIKFTGKNKEDVRAAVSEFATVREEENNAITITGKGRDIGKLLYKDQFLVITGGSVQVYSQARFEAEFDVEEKPKAPKKPVAPKAPGKVEADGIALAEEAKAAKVEAKVKAPEEVEPEGGVAKSVLPK